MAREPVDDTVGGSADVPQPPKASRDGKRVVQPAAAIMKIEGESLVSDGFVELDPSVTRSPMTQAERSAKHYAANKELRREANKLRMRAKRKNE